MCGKFQIALFQIRNPCTYEAGGHSCSQPSGEWKSHRWSSPSSCRCPEDDSLGQSWLPRFAVEPITFFFLTFTEFRAPSPESRPYTDLPTRSFFKPQRPFCGISKSTLPEWNLHALWKAKGVKTIRGASCGRCYSSEMEPLPCLAVVTLMWGQGLLKAC